MAAVRTISIDDADSEKRKLIAGEIAELVKKGMVTVRIGNDDRKVSGYDSKTNEWLLVTPKKPSERVSAQGKPACAVAPDSGG